MHARRTRLVKGATALTGWVGAGARLVGVAKTAEYRGVITTYKVYDKLLANRMSRRRYAHGPPALDDVQRAILADLDANDYAVVPLADLVRDPTLRDRIQADGEAFAAETEAQLAGTSQAVLDSYKDYLVRRYPRASQIAPDTPWLEACLSERLLGLANAYLRMWTKLEYVDFWYSVPVSPEAQRVKSQRWHRDYDDRHLLKAFLYLVDVDEGTGPFEFVAGSARGGTLANLQPWFPLSDAYPSDADFQRAVPLERIRTFTAPRGTVVLCNTSGFHRGGFATTKPRVLATATYCSPASLKTLTERNYALPAGAAGHLSPVQRYAVS